MNILVCSVGSDFEPFWPYIRLEEYVHVGKGSSFGLGRQVTQPIGCGNKGSSVPGIFPMFQNFKKLRESFAGVQTDKPVAFALSLTPTGGSIRKSVETFLKKNKLKMDIEELKMNGINNETDIERFINLLREKRHFFEETGVIEIHLFIAGPVQSGTIIGALYANWIPIKLYHKPTPPPPHVYEYWTPLSENCSTPL